MENVLLGASRNWWQSDNAGLTDPYYAPSAWEAAFAAAGLTLTGAHTDKSGFTLWLTEKPVKKEVAAEQTNRVTASDTEENRESTSTEQALPALHLFTRSKDAERKTAALFECAFAGTDAAKLQCAFDATSSENALEALASQRSELFLVLPTAFAHEPSFDSDTVALIQLLAKREKEGLHVPSEILFIALKENARAPSIALEALRGLLRTAGNEIRATRFGLWEVEDSPAALHSLQSLVTRRSELPSELRITKDALVRLQTAEATSLKACGAEKASTTLLTFETPGRLEKLRWEEVSSKKLSEGHIRVAVRATGLNFRDVMWTMGMLPEEALEDGFAGPTLGLECAGVVTETSPQSRYSVGDRVLGFGPSCFASELVTSESAVAPIPAHLTFEEAATLPVAFFTAWYALSYCARARKGERVLIHGAAGGVGLAAIQCAHLLGLEVYATAGSAAKRAFLASLGVKHLYDSRSLSFAEEIRRDTEGLGVDIVLNSLAGVAAEKSLELLAPFGRFLEIGKRDFYADSAMHLRLFRKNLSYFGIDVDQLLLANPALTAELFGELMSYFERGELRPLPYTVFAARDAVEAFKAMQSSSHIGKLIVQGAKPQENRAACEPNAQQNAQGARLRVRPNRTYIISGGTSGIGLALAAKLSAAGATDLLLLSRSGRVAQTHAATLSAIQNRGTRVKLAAIDVAQTEAESYLLAALCGLPSVAGIVHAAGIIEDGLLAELPEESFTHVWGPKVRGAETLDRVSRTLSEPLDWFIGFSSATVLIGNPGQANYVQANAALAALFEARARAGLPATLIALGAVSDVGMLSRNAEAQRLLVSHFGVGTITTEAIWAALGLMQQSDLPYAHYVGLEWQKIAKLRAFTSGRFTEIARRTPQSVAAGGDFVGELAELSESEATVRLTDFIAGEIARVMGIARDEISASKPITELGMDSLLVVELGSALEERLGKKIPSNALTGAASAETLAAALYRALFSEAETDTTLEVMAKQQGVVLTEALREELGSGASDAPHSAAQKSEAQDAPKVAPAREALHVEVEKTFTVPTTKVMATDQVAFKDTFEALEVSPNHKEARHAAERLDTRSSTL